MVLLYVNGRRHTPPASSPSLLLLEYLRETLRLTGAKLGCGEGGCGACTVMVSRWDAAAARATHVAVNACLVPVATLDGAHVTTVEGIGRVGAMHSVQRRMEAAHASQCGFCTPGITMALYAFLRGHPDPTEHELEEALDGVLCRCTGYRPILDVAKSFGVDHGTASQSRLSKGCGRTDCCRLQSSSGDTKRLTVEGVADTSSLLNADLSAPPASTTSPEWLNELGPFDGSSELLFPAELRNWQPQSLRIEGDRVLWLRPVSLPELLDVKAMHPAARLVGGNTEIGIEIRFKKRDYPTLVDHSAVPELQDMAVDCASGALTIGASVTLNALATRLRAAKAELAAPHMAGAIDAILFQLKYFAGNQVRNVAAVAGNLVTASPISDLNPVWVATGAVVRVASKARGVREIPAGAFFLSYRKVDLADDEVVVAILVPGTREGEFVQTYKQARRRDDDIALVTSCMRAVVAGSPPCVTEASLAYGGMAPTTVAAPATQAALVGIPVADLVAPVTFERLTGILAADDVPLAPGTPGGMVEYRASLAASFLFKFLLHIQQQVAPALVAPEDASGSLQTFDRPVTQSSQRIQVHEDRRPVSYPIAHASGSRHVTGEAIYVDDIPLPPFGLHAAFVTSKKAHAEILAADYSATLASPGVVDVVTHADIPGRKLLGAIAIDEELLASTEVHHVGQPIAIVVARSEADARRAATLAEIQYKELDSVVTIDEAIAKDSFFDVPPQVFESDPDLDMDAALAKCDHLVSGTLRVGGQEHFYFETQAALASPGEAGEMAVTASTQNPTKAQEMIADVLGQPRNRVTVKVKRMGGGFGGKEIRSCFIAAAMAVAAHKVRAPVRIQLERSVDMALSGGRHPFRIDYRLGFDKVGHFEVLDATLFSNGGFSLDLTAAVMERALLSCNNAYRIPHMRVRGRLCRTNLPSNTAFRGFGGPQGMIAAEAWLEHAARTLGLAPEILRARNMYRSGDVTHYGQTIERCTLPRIWRELGHGRATTASDDDASLDVIRAAQSENALDKVCGPHFAAVRAACDEYNRAHRFRKRGTALIMTHYGIAFTAKFMNQGAALVHIYQDGTVLVTHGGTEMGQGLHTKMCQIAAKVLGVPVADVYVADTATDKVANTMPTAASSQTDLNGGAVQNACEILAERLRPVRERLGGATVPMSKVATEAHLERINLSANGFFRTQLADNEIFNYFTNGGALAVVEVDCLTGDHQLLRTDLVMDVGESINPALDIGQVEGGFLQGVGWSTIEELVWGDKGPNKWLPDGAMLTTGPGTYKIPSASNVPLEWNVGLLADSPNPRVVYSSKGIGEPPLFLGSSAYWAIKDAVHAFRASEGMGTDHFVLDSPATCERVRLACTKN